MERSKDENGWKSEDKQKSEQDGDQGSGQGKGKPSDKYGPYGQGPNGDGTLDTYSLDKLFEDMDSLKNHQESKHKDFFDKYKKTDTEI